ncbi:OB-fold nucleic acid binding domain-containing protein [Motilibacter aurantiacus]|uniref:OB-fold nucleic acid binding domain-containing protein n=1 Tax=Motilibacter aurantiacus TaxID=2714955 RepID=UPI001408F1AB|nr:OB-fold nucleic acid binding domain-containing protein [Motilibacter aurantiacus]NHC46177.1 OB-fold nucleic acid binding domain-containing protein [Motilibacter aurantiacus]
MATTGRGGLFRRALERLTSSDDEIEAQQLRHGAQEEGAQHIASCRDRDQVTVSGTLRTVTLRPRAGVPALEAELYDGSGTLAVVWLGRRRIPGIDPGRTIRATGRVANDDGRRVMFNPRYELRPAGRE